MASMAKKKTLDEIAKAMGAKVVSKVPETGGGAFGAARLGRIVAELQSKLVPGKGKRPGRPTNQDWTRRPKVPMTDETYYQLKQIAKKVSSPSHQVSPMQIAAQIVEATIASVQIDSPLKWESLVKSIKDHSQLVH